MVRGAGVGETMQLAENKREILGKERPGVEPVPLLTDLRGNAEFCLAFLQHLDDLAAVAAQKLELQPVELPLDLIEKRNEQREVDGMSQRYPKRADLAALEGGSERPRADGRLITLLEQRMHALAEFGHLRRPFAPEQVAAELGFELLDRARQRRLRHMAFLGGAGEIRKLRHREKVTDLVHLHGLAPSKIDAKPSRPSPGMTPRRNNWPVSFRKATRMSAKYHK